MIDSKVVTNMQQGVMLINKSRGSVIDTFAIINGLKSSKISTWDWAFMSRREIYSFRIYPIK